MIGLDLIPLPVRIGALVAVIAGASVAGWTARGVVAERDIDEIKDSIAQQREQAVTAARAEEHQQQEKVNESLRKQNATLGRVNAGLRRDRDGLRNRPERPADIPDAGRAACAGGTGAELSREDAEFLVGEAARADECRAGLTAAYEVIDARQ